MALFGWKQEGEGGARPSAAPLESAKFSNPHEEIAYLRTQVAERERELVVQGKTPERAQVAHEQVTTYRTKAPEALLALFGAQFFRKFFLHDRLQSDTHKSLFYLENIFIPNPLQEAFSKGILNYKIF